MSFLHLQSLNLPFHSPFTIVLQEKESTKHGCHTHYHVNLIGQINSSETAAKARHQASFMIHIHTNISHKIRSKWKQVKPMKLVNNHHQYHTPYMPKHTYIKMKQRQGKNDIHGMSIHHHTITIHHQKYHTHTYKISKTLAPIFNSRHT